MPQARPQLLRYAIAIHRWLGVGFSLLFAMWFLSGMVMMYWPFPEPEGRLRRAVAIDAKQLHMLPQEALIRIGTVQSPEAARITMLDGRPAYRFYFGRSQRVVFADDGSLLDLVSPEMGRRIASAWTSQPAAAATFDGTLTEADQWTVNGILRSHGTLLKYSWPNGEQVYVSPRTAEIVQHTTRNSRIAAYFGAIPHWLYFAPLRRSAKVWRGVVIWASGIGTGVSLLGLIIGVWVYSPSQRYRLPQGPSGLPYTGIKRWHAILGLIFGLVTCTWAFSGMLSMDPFPSLSRETSSGQTLAEALRGGELRMVDFADRQPAAVLAEAGRKLEAKEIELRSFAGKPFYLVTTGDGESTIVPIHGTAISRFDRQQIVEVVQAAIQPYKVEEVRMVTEYESYYLDRRRRLPLPVIIVRLNDPERSIHYIDPRIAQIVESYSSTARWNRWLYHGLHSLDLPWLYGNRPAWDIVVLALMLGGTTLSLTSILMGWRVLARKLGLSGVSGATEN